MLAKEIEDFLNNNQWNEAIQLIKTIPLPLSDEETAASPGATLETLSMKMLLNYMMI